MFFILSKILIFIISPMVWIGTFLLLAIFSKNEKIKKRSLIFSCICFLVFSNSFITNECMNRWELPATKKIPNKQFEAGIVLSGMAWYDFDLKRIQFFSSADRIFQAIQLYKEGYIKKIVVSGGSGSLMYEDQKEAIFLRDYMLKIGVPDSVIFIESISKNTRENAVCTKTLLQENKIEGDYLLITSARHMRRSIGCFEKIGIKVTPFSVDRRSGPTTFHIDKLLLPKAGNIEEWDGLLHEIIGYYVYRFSGYI